MSTVTDEGSELIVYNYDELTFELLGSSLADPNPMDGTPLVPRLATLTTPPEVKVDKVATYDPEADAWLLDDDFRGVAYWLDDGSRHVVSEIGQVPPKNSLDAAPHVPRDQQLAAALRRIDIMHAEWLEAMTGHATIAERDTWKSKEEAARAFVANTANAGQTAMLTVEATARDEPVADLAALVISKADGFLTLIGLAGSLRAQGRAAITAATDEDVDLEDVADEISAALDALSDSFAAAAVAVAAGS